MLEHKFKKKKVMASSEPPRDLAPVVTDHKAVFAGRRLLQTCCGGQRCWVHGSVPAVLVVGQIGLFCLLPAAGVALSLAPLGGLYSPVMAGGIACVVAIFIHGISFCCRSGCGGDRATMTFGTMIHVPFRSLLVGTAFVTHAAASVLNR
jgi:hypothetical protein